jgi:hypothetical protein
MPAGTSKNARPGALSLSLSLSLVWEGMKAHLLTLQFPPVILVCTAISFLKGETHQKVSGGRPCRLRSCWSASLMKNKLIRHVWSRDLQGERKRKNPDHHQHYCVRLCAQGWIVFLLFYYMTVLANLKFPFKEHFRISVLLLFRRVRPAVQLPLNRVCDSHYQESGRVSIWSLWEVLRSFRGRGRSECASEFSVSVVKDRWGGGRQDLDWLVRQSQ